MSLALEAVKIDDVEESPLLEAIARERLMRTHQAEKKISGFCGDL
jgi:hypothetical protein